MEDNFLLRELVPGHKWWGLGLIIFATLIAWVAGAGIAQRNYLPALLGLAIFALGLLLHDAHVIIILAWLAFYLVPYGSFRTPIPFLSSPLMAFAFSGLVLGLLRLFTRRIELPKSNLYSPIAMWVAVLIFFIAIGHGPHIAESARWYLQGMWSWALVVLLVRTPSQARSVLCTLLVLSVYSVWRIVPPAIQTGVISPEQNLSATDLRLITVNSVGNWGGFSQAVQMSALTWPLFYSFSIMPGINLLTRCLAGISVVITGIAVISIGTGTQLLTVGAGAGVVSIIALRRNRGGRKLGSVMIIGIALAMLLLSSGGQAQLNRVREVRSGTGTGGSLAGRLSAIGPGIEAFIARPLAGWGDYWYPSEAPFGTRLYQLHNSVLQIAVRFGLMGLLPAVLMFSKIGHNLWRLSKKSLNSVDRALITGIQAVYIAYLVQGFLSVSFGIISWDSVFWFLIGLSVIWLDWLDKGLHSQLV